MLISLLLATALAAQPARTAVHLPVPPARPPDHQPVLPDLSSTSTTSNLPGTARSAAAHSPSVNASGTLPGDARAAATPAPEGRPSREIAFESLLVVSDVRRAGREATYKDAIDEMVVLGTWHSPHEGDEVRLPDGTTRIWKTLTAQAPGVFEDESLDNGYAVAVFSVPEAGVMLLDASGHRWVYANGVPRAGDVYGLGFNRLPVLLRKGDNELLFNVTQGRLTARLTPPPAEAFIDTRDATLPDVIVGESGTLHLGMIVVNATTVWERGLRVRARYQGVGAQGEMRGEPVRIPAIPPVSTRKVDIPITPPAALVEGVTGRAPAGDSPGPDQRKGNGQGAQDTGAHSLAGTGGAREAGPAAEAGGTRADTETDPSRESPVASRRITVLLDLIGRDGRVLHTASIGLAVRQPGETHKRTFLSGIDGSVQYYAVTPALTPGSESLLESDDSEVAGDEARRERGGMVDAGRPGNRSLAGTMKSPVSEAGDLTDAGRAPGLVLTLHGAGVEGAEQARRYRPRGWTHIVAPTNRRPFGFDWEDWGRLDALEVLAIATGLLQPDPRRVWLTGHSMGGHGTWNLGAHFPGLFAAIAPSAGWRDFWSYLADRAPTPAAPASRTAAASGADDSMTDSPRDPVERMLERAANASRTLLLERNLSSEGIYILHGDQDDNVPVTQARAMRERLGAFHTNFAYYERPGAGHWWGDECMDWPPLMEFLRRNEFQDSATLAEIEFVTVNPGISSRFGWIEVETQEHSLMPSRVHASVSNTERRLTLSTENIARLSIDLGMLAPAPEGEPGPDRPAPLLARGKPFSVTIDGQDLDAFPWPGEDGGAHRVEDHPGRDEETRDGSSAGSIADRTGERPAASGVHRPAGREAGGAALRLMRSVPGGAWRPVDRLPGLSKHPLRGGPFKDAFRNRMMFVYGTAGTPEENAWSFMKARYDAETFWYRGNGSVDIVADTEFDAWAEPDRNIILYGNADTNAAWSEVLPDGPVVVRRGLVRVGDRVEKGDDLACLFIYPRDFSTVASVGVVSGTGPAGFRLTNQLPYFVSGIGYPDWVVIDAGMLERGVEGVRGAGFFGPDWSLDRGDAAWRTGAPTAASR